MAACTVHELAHMAGVTVRTLHHYDRIGLLKPASRTAAGYRLYGEKELLRLQQILFFRELDVPLAEIRDILDDPAFDEVIALREHRKRLLARRERLTHLLTTIDKTIRKLTEGDTMLTDKELYEGFTKEQAERYPREAREMYGPEIVAETERRLRRLSKEDWRAIKAEGDEITRRLVELMDRQPDDVDVQAAIARHYAWIKHFWTPTAESYAGLGQLYAENDEFRATYDRYAAGLADFLCEAMSIYAERHLAHEAKA